MDAEDSSSGQCVLIVEHMNHAVAGRKSLRDVPLTYRRCAVLGSTSFAGAAFVSRALADGAEVIGISRSPEGPALFLPHRAAEVAGQYRFQQGDLNNDLSAIDTLLGEFRPQVIVDFAGQGMVAESWSDPAQWYTTNIVSKVRLHDLLRRRTWLERYVRISTPEVYGSHEEPLSETWRLNPSTPYAVSHAAIDLSLRAFHRQYGFPVIFTRFSNFYGPGQQLYRIVPRTIICALAGRKIQLHGGGTSIRAFIHSAEVADGIMRTLERGTPGEIYHFAPLRAVSIRDLVGLICDRMGVRFEAVAETAGDRPAKDHAYLMDSSRARRELGWSEFVSLEDGIDATIRWIRDNFAQIATLPWDYVHKA